MSLTIMSITTPCRRKADPELLELLEDALFIHEELGELRNRVGRLHQRLAECGPAAKKATELARANGVALAKRYVSNGMLVENIASAAGLKLNGNKFEPA